MFKAEKLIDEIKEEQNDIDFDKLLCVKSDGKTYFNFGIFEDLQKLASDICYMGSLEDAKDVQCKMFTLLNDLRNYKPTNPDKIRERKETLTKAKMLHNSRNRVIKAFDKVFPFKDGFQKEEPDMPEETLPDWVRVDK